MVTKAYIQEVVTNNLVRLRIPLYHKPSGVNGAIIDDLLPYACINTLPNIKVNPEVGDVVIVAFEEDDLYRPVVIGYLQLKEDTKADLDILCDDLTATGAIRLGQGNATPDITIGEIPYTSIETLKNQTENINGKFQSVDANILTINNEIETINHSIGGIEDDIGDINDQISTTTDAFTAALNGVRNLASNNSIRVSDIENTLSTDLPSMAEDISENTNALATLTKKVNELEAALANYIKKNAIIIDSGSYGNDLNEINGPKDGQIYFMIK